jgi:tetratricopeptide (TPR) repeat protein
LLAVTLENLAGTHQLRADYDAAAALLMEALELRRSLGVSVQVAHVLQNLGQIRLDQLDYDSAEVCFREALADLFVSNRGVFGWALAGLSRVAWQRGDAVRAARLLARAEALHQEIGLVLTPNAMALHKRATRDLRSARDRPEIDVAWQEGAVLPLEQALAEALAT